MAKNKEIVIKEKNGLRKGINKEDIIKSLTDDDWSRIKLMKDLENVFIKDGDAYQFAVRTDQMYQEWEKSYSTAEAYLSNIIMTKVRLEKNKIDILKGETTRTFQETNTLLSVRDLDIENINLNRIINDELRKLYMVMADLFRYTDVSRIDKIKFFTKQDYTDFVGYVRGKLKENGIEIFKERHKMGQI